MPDPPAGWHPDPHDPSRLRWWDGNAWTEHLSAAGPEAPGPAVGGPDNDPAAGAAATDGTPSGATASGPTASGGAPDLPAGLRGSTLFSEGNREAETTGRMTRQNSAVIKVTLGEPLVVTKGSMMAFQGEVDFAHAGAGAKRAFKASMTGEKLSMMRCSGRGEVFVAHHGDHLHLMELGAGDRVSVSSRSLLGFDESVHWDVERISGGMAAMAAGGLYNVTLTGPGTVIVASHHPVILNPAEARTLADPDAVVAWSAGLEVTARSSFKASSLIGRGSGELMQLEFTGQGFLVIEPEPEPRSTAG